ncbi:beta-1,4-galactosyltransferase 5-like [Porites lutea]|uniref:beta-1,4-galactosyltransferase 5-like n=1 Tax=Porites lutea TaxID=51062 RepID=UPI003CC5BF1B
MTSLHRLTKKLFLVSILAFALYVGMVLYYVFSSTKHLTRLKKAGGLFNNTVSIRTLNMSTTHAPLKEIIDRSYDRTDPGLKQSQPEVALKEECQENSSLLAGPIPLDLSIPKMDDIERQISRDFDGWVSNGGIWSPTECEAKVKVAFIIPFRNRFEQLSVFLRHMHPLLKKQKLDYRIFVVEQSGDAPFNRAMLFNVGFKEALKFDEYKCFIFHDVDLLPEDYRNKYNCNSSPRHMANAMDTFHYR